MKCMLCGVRELVLRIFFLLEYYSKFGFDAFGMVFYLGYFWINAQAILWKFTVDKEFKLVQEAVGKDKILVGSLKKKKNRY